MAEYSFSEQAEEPAPEVVFKGSVICDGVEHSVDGVGNGPIDAFFKAISQVGLNGYEFVSYHQHAISSGSDSKAIAYIGLKRPDGKTVFGGVSTATSTKRLFWRCWGAINRSLLV